MEEIFTAIFFTVVFLGRSVDGEFLKITSCDRPHLYCYREDFFALCLDAEKLHVFWKLNAQCFLGTNCEHDDFPCGLPSPQGVLAVAQSYNLTNVVADTMNSTNITTTTNSTDTTGITNVTTPTNSTKTGTIEIANVTTTTTEITESTETETTSINTTTPETTTTIGPPACTSTDTFKGPTCQQYYQCISVWWWYEPTLVTCSSGQSYNATANSCSPDATCTP